MSDIIRSSSDVIIRTEAWAQATEFYEFVLGLPVTHRSENLVGFDTGVFCLYVEKGQEHGPVFEFFVRDVEAAKSSCSPPAALSRKKTLPCRVATYGIPTASSLTLQKPAPLELRLRQVATCQKTLIRQPAFRSVAKSSSRNRGRRTFEPLEHTVRARGF